jgi:hypothetical protein
MTLEEFVSDTLIQIVSGVENARRKSLRVAPRVVHHTGHDTPVIQADAKNPRAFLVDFDVAVTVSKTSDTEAKGGVSIHVFEAGGHRSSSADQSTVSRIKFEVPVTYDD